MSLNSNKIIVYTSPRPQPQYLTTCPTGTTDLVLAESSVNHVPKRTTYRVKISNSKDFEVLSTAAKFGLTSWVGGQKVRIVGVAPKRSSEFAAADSQVAVSESHSLSASETDSNCSRAVSASHPASVTDWNCLAVSGEEKHHPGLNTASVVLSDSKSCTSSTFSDTMHVISCTPLQSSVTSTCQSLLISSHCKLRGSLKTTANIGIQSGHDRSESSNSLAKPCDSVVSQGLPPKVNYLGTIAVNTRNFNASSVGAQSSPGVNEKSVISAVKKFTESLNGNKLLNGKHLNEPPITCIKSNHVWKTHSQPLIQAENCSGVSVRGLKRPYMEDCTTDVVSNKRMAHSVKISTDGVEDCSFSAATKSGAHRQPLTSNMLNHVAARLMNSAQYVGYSHHSTNDTVMSSQQAVEVNNNSTSQPSILLQQVPKFTLPPGSVFIRYKDYKLDNVTRQPHVTPDVQSSKNDSSLQPDKLVLPSDSETCARLRPFNSTRKKYSSFTFLLSHHRVSDVRFDDNYTGYTGYKRRMELCDLPMAMRFRHLREFCTETVAVHRSTIHGLGLFCLRDVSGGEMLMEYAGEVIRASVADVRERRYDAQGIGCYMFRCGDDNVVDATKCGNAARFINHSCEPNCYSRQIVIDGRVHIVIFALRDVRCGEELTYDYKFPIEQVKMPCFCKSRRCRKYLN